MVDYGTLMVSTSSIDFLCTDFPVLFVGKFKLQIFFQSCCHLKFISTLQLLESVAEKFDAIISSFTHLDNEFSHMLQMTKSYKFQESIEGSVLRNGMNMKAKLSWATLHSLLHSERISYRQNGYIWLGDLLIAEISEERNGSIWSNIKKLQQQIAYAGVNDASSASDVPLSIWLMCGLLKSRNYIIRWGFLFVLERLLMRCKFLLDENEMQHANGSDVRHADKDSRLEKANAVIDIMSIFLSLVINETDRINILKVIVWRTRNIYCKHEGANYMRYMLKRSHFSFNYFK